jgi:probable rRNA maturation factor
VNLSLENQTKYEVNIKLLEKVTKEMTDKEVELIVCYNDYIQALNLQFRNQDKPTDVLSFPVNNMANIANFPLGSIIISVDFVKQKSEELNHSFDDELTLLFIHGLLHLSGYDHEIDNGEHRAKEEELVKQFNLPNSLIIRTNKG